MSTISKQWLQQKIAEMEDARDEIPFGLDEDDSNTLAALRITLASLEAEAVAYIIQDSDARGRGEKGILRYFANISDEDINEYQITVTPLYTAPPAPASVPEWTNKQCLEFLSIAFRHAEINGDLQLDDIRLGVKMVNGSRAAMLQGAERVSNRDELTGGWVACSERMPVENDIVLVVDDGYFVCEAQYREGDFYSAVRGGGEFFETTCRDVELWMPLPAAPQQEAKNV